ncbi:MAG: hypothetical protein Q8S00_04225 [Deltaproteobacteria bacterium]|nr:hypothetical protein [Deltaproteobacteria bacterium]
MTEEQEQLAATIVEGGLAQIEHNCRITGDYELREKAYRVAELICEATGCSLAHCTRA